jgi:hypothetical protein
MVIEVIVGTEVTGRCAMVLLCMSSWRGVSVGALGSGDSSGGRVLQFLFFLAFLASTEAAAGPLEAVRRAALVDFWTVSLVAGSVDMVVGGVCSSIEGEGF